MDLDPAAYDLLSDWWVSGNGTDGDHQLVLTFLESVADGSWRDRWFREPYLATKYGSEAHVVQPRPGLRLIVVLDFDGEPGVMQLLGIDAE